MKFIVAMAIGLTGCAFTCCGCSEFLDALAAGGAGFSQGMSGGTRRPTNACFSNANCEANAVCAIANGQGHGICVVPNE
jgi:hypothetical protein